MSRVIEGKLIKRTGEVEEGESLLGGSHECQRMNEPGGCPNVCYEADQYDEDGNRISKHHWYCTQCNFIQVG
jgi:hypothetical protein